MAAYAPSFFQYEDIEGKSKVGQTGISSFSFSSNKQFECHIRRPLLAHPQAWVRLDSLLLYPHDWDEDFANPDGVNDEYHYDLETEPTEAQKKICEVIKIYFHSKK